MRLERVIAKDSRRATEQVIEQFGADALIISNQRVNGMTEIVVAVDIDSQPLEETPVNRAARSNAETRRPFDLQAMARPDTGRSDTGRPDTGRLDPGRRAEPPLRSLPKAPEDAEPGFADVVDPPFAKALDHSPGSVRAPAQAAFGALRPPETDGLRARELVEMVREELASMRREITLSRQMVTHANSRRLPAALQPLAEALEQAEVPAALRSLLVDQIANCADATQALDALRTSLCASIKTSAEREAFEGLHVISGPSGSGKTHMACRLAARHASRRGSASVALIGFADQRIGAWTQLQMLAARSGVDCFKVADAALLGPLLSEISDRELVLIDTSASAWKEGLASIADCAPAARFHLLMPADASGTNLRRYQGTNGWSWHSLMLSKLDECQQPWPVIQSLCNQEFALSVGSFDHRPDAPPSELDTAELVGKALATFPGLVCEPPAEPARSRRAAPRKTAKDMRHAA